ncbi:MAG: hypothetical protein HUK04_01710 [Bacteroidaceae bacterium]|nr:hypothetical protein [Bacteroidaceae bacterium]
MSKYIKAIILLLLVGASTASAKRHYGVNYNFRVAVDSVAVQENDPLICIDSVRTHYLRRHQAIVVARFQSVPTDTLGTIWVQVGTYSEADSVTQEPHAELVWLREKELLVTTVPDKVVSRLMHAIAIRADMLFTITLGPLVFLLMARYLQRHPEEGGARKTSILVMLLDGIDTLYPWLLAVSVAASTVVAHLVDTDEWVRFYFSPTLNPLVADNRLISVTLSLIWFTIIALIATMSEIFRTLPTKRALVYTLSVPCVCSFIIWLIMQMYDLFVEFMVRFTAFYML